MSVWDIKLEREEIPFGNALVSLYQIESDMAIAEREQIHTHSYYELHTVLQNSRSYTIGEKTVLVRPGELVIVPPETAHKAVPPWEKRNIAVLSVSVRLLPSGEAVFDSLIQRLELCSAAAIPLNGRLVHLIDAYSASSQKGMRNVFHRKLAACEILVGIFDAIGCGEGNRAGRSQVDFDIMLETLVHNSDAPLYEIAQRLGYSQRQISRIIQKRYQKTFAQLRKETK